MILKVMLVMLSFTGVALSAYRGLYTHNELRAVHGSQPMTFSQELKDSATAYAQKLAAGAPFDFSPESERPNQGENVAMGCRRDRGMTAEEAIKMWYDEVCYNSYDFDVGPVSGKQTRQFTQLVWNDSTMLGVGKADVDKWGMKCSYLVARYSPRGNEGDFQANVQEGTFDRETYCNSLKKRSAKKSAMFIKVIRPYPQRKLKPTPLK